MEPIPEENSGSAPAAGENDPRFRPSLALLVFLGSLFGTLLGLTGDLADAVDAVTRFWALTYPQVCVVGSSTLLDDRLELMANWKTEFEADVNARLVFLPVGSQAGLERAVAGECAQVLAMSEPLQGTDLNQLQEAGVGVDCAAEIAYDPIIFVTDFNNPVPSLSLQQIVAILKGEITHWEEVGGRTGPIRILYNPGGGTTSYILEQLAGIESVERLPEQAGYLACHSASDCLDQALAIPGSFYWASAAWLHTQPEYFRVNAIRSVDGKTINPYSEQSALKDYPAVLIRPLYLYVLDGPGGSLRAITPARAFINYARSARAQQWVEQARFYSYFWRPEGVNVVLPPGFETAPDGRRQVCRATP